MTQQHDPSPSTDELVDQFWDYLHGRLDADAAQAFEQALLSNEQAAEACRDLAETMVLTQEAFQNQDAAIQELQHLTGPELLQELARREAHAKVQAEPQPIRIGSSTPLTSKAYASALSYVIEHTFTPKRVAVMATAAAVLLGVVLTIVFLAGGDETPEQTAGLPDYTPVTPTTDPNQVVATITGQSQAVWVSANGQGALPDQTLLGPNQRLTLAKGFTEITTNRGAKVLVQAPATIETTNSDNAIRLHRGKLVGICETPSSKGFTVHAPGMDVVDLGTRFGVEADAEQGSTVLVLEGSVRAEPAPESPLAFEPVVLGRDDARRVEPETGGLETIAVVEAPVYYESVPHPYVQAVLDAKPVAYWRFEGDADQMIANEVDPGYGNLKAYGGTSLSDQGLIGKAGSIANSDDRDQYFLTSDPLAQLDGAEEYTLECWFYLPEHLQQASSVAGMYSALPAQGYRIVNQLELSGIQPHEASPIAFSARFHQQTATGGDGLGKFSDRPYRKKHWHHYVLTKSDGLFTVYLDSQFLYACPASPVSRRISSINSASSDKETSRRSMTLCRPWLSTARICR
ncbi:MAG: FecR family protein [Planctomycetota bacterium]